MHFKKKTILDTNENKEMGFWNGVFLGIISGIIIFTIILALLGFIN